MHVSRVENLRAVMTRSLLQLLLCCCRRHWRIWGTQGPFGTSPRL
jgi:hypothetical protein